MLELICFHLAESDAKKLWTEASKIKFAVCRVSEHFSLRSTFSGANIIHEKIEKIPVSHLVRFDVHCLTHEDSDENIARAVRLFLNLFNNLPTLRCARSNTESEVLQKILIPLCQEACLEKKYSACCQSPNVKVGLLGMGLFNTLHGQPDCRIRGAVLEDLDISLVDNETDDTDSGTLTVDDKKTLAKEHTSQLIATNVVASFVEKNKHSDCNTLIPSLMVDNERVIICLYDCDKDNLLLSDTVDLYDNGNLDGSAILFIWLFINHR